MGSGDNGGNGDSGFNFKDWYAEHGDKLNQSRRKKYENDPEYRERVLKMNRDSRERRRKEREAERRKERKSVKTKPLPTPFKTVSVRLSDGEDGSHAELFSIGALARALGCSVQAIRIWERKGQLPPAEVRNAKGDRLYTAHGVELRCRLMREQGRLSAEDESKPFEWDQPKPVVRRVRLSDGTTEELELFKIGVLAAAIGRTVLTVEQMESRGALPETPFRASSTRYRLYTGEMIEAAAVAMDARGGSIRGAERWREFYDEVHNKWAESGVLGAALVDEGKRG